MSEEKIKGKSILLKLKDYLIGWIILGIVLSVGSYFISSWNYWFPDVEKVKLDCLVKEGDYIFSYDMCLKLKNVEMNNSDIRKVCSIQAKAEYSVNGGKTENQYYLDCVRSQGLAN